MGREGHAARTRRPTGSCRAMLVVAYSPLDAALKLDVRPLSITHG